MTTTTPKYTIDQLVGKRVRRGPDWKWEDQDGGAGRLGTVKDESAFCDGWVYVRWDNGDNNSYRWGDDNKYDLEVVGESLEEWAEKCRAKRVTPTEEPEPDPAHARFGRTVKTLRDIVMDLDVQAMDVAIDDDGELYKQARVVREEVMKLAEELPSYLR